MNYLKRIVTLCAVVSVSYSYAQEQKRYRFTYEAPIENIEQYNQRNIEAYNAVEKLKLRGTLLTPKTAYDKVVIIVPGTGEDSRDNHFKLAQILLDNGIGVFRYDERGISLSEGDFYAQNYANTEMANDLTAIFNEVKNTVELQGKQLGLIGHSLGGMATVEAVYKGVKADFLIQWATPTNANKALKYQLKQGLSGLPQQFKYDNIEDSYPVIDLFTEAMLKTNDTTTLKQDIKILKAVRKEAKKIGYTKDKYDYWYFSVYYAQKSFMKKNFQKMYGDLSIPTLYLIGSEDIYVDPQGEVATLKEVNNPCIEVKYFERLDHYLTTAGAKLEISKAMYDIAAEASDVIVEWLKDK